MIISFVLGILVGITSTVVVACCYVGGDDINDN